MKFNKYNAKKCTYNGIEFDSKKEMNRYIELKLLERAGKIQDLQLQVKFELVPKQTEPILGKRGTTLNQEKTLEQAVNYIADFVYLENGEKVVEDVKGYKQGGAYSVFVIKRKLMLYKYNIKIKEV